MSDREKTIVELTKHYLRYLKLERGYSPNTVEAYKHDLEWLLGYLEQEGLDPLSVKLEDLEHFAAMLSDHGISAKSQARILSGVRSFYRYLVLDGYLDVDPTELLESPHLPQHLPEYLSTEEVDALENSIDLTSNEGHRNRAIIEVFFSCGLRVSELTNLKLSDLFLSQGFIRVNGKGGKQRLVPISERAIHELELWFDDRRQMEIKPGEEDYVFLNRRGHHLTRTMILIMVKRQAELRVSRRRSRRTHSATPLRRLCSRAEPICASSRSCSGMLTSAQRRSIPTWTTSRCGRKSSCIIPETSSMRQRTAENFHFQTEYADAFQYYFLTLQPKAKRQIHENQSAFFRDMGANARCRRRLPSGGALWKSVLQE